jgi:hypothetical protein
MDLSIIIHFVVVGFFLAMGLIVLSEALKG